MGESRVSSLDSARGQKPEFGHQGSVSLLNITQTHFVHRVGAEFGHQGSVSLLNITVLRLTLLYTHRIVSAPRLALGLLHT